MKKLIVLFLTMFSSTVLASDDQKFICFDGRNSMNGLDIHSIQLFISSEDPEAEMRILFSDGKSRRSLMSYHTSDCGFVLEPNSSTDGTISVNLCKKSGRWSATVRQEHLDTFSILMCVEA